MANRTLNVKAVCEMTGIHPSTLRAWERRYGAVTPARSQTGRRAYGWAEVERLRLLNSLVQQGHSISQIAKLTSSELAQNLEPSPEPHDSRESLKARWVQPVLKAVQDYRLERIQVLLARARVQLGASVFVLDVVSPMLGLLGEQVASGTLGVGQEHALSAILRSQLYPLLPAAPVRSDGLVFATPEGDHHEFGVLLAAILSADAGFGISYLGPNMPAASLADALKALRPRALVLGTSASSLRDIREYLRELESTGVGVPIWVGGVATHIVRKLRSGLKFVCFDTLRELDGHLKSEKGGKR